MKNLSAIDWIALILVLVGGLNWGLVGLADFNLVALLFGEMSFLSRVVYAIVGVATIYLAIISRNLGKKA